MVSDRDAEMCCLYGGAIQVWQWVRHAAKTAEGTKITPCIVRETVADRVRSLMDGGMEGHKFRLAGKLVGDMMTAPELDDFLTTIAYPHIVEFAHCRL